MITTSSVKGSNRNILWSPGSQTPTSSYINDLRCLRKKAEKTLEVEPGYANGRLTAGSIYANMGELERAEEQFRKVLELDPSNKNAQVNLQRLRAARGAQ